MYVRGYLQGSENGRVFTINILHNISHCTHDTRYSIMYAIFLPFSTVLFCFIVFSTFNFKRFSSISASVVANLLQPLLYIVLLLLIINALNTQHDLILVLGHPVNQGEAGL